MVILRSARGPLVFGFTYATRGGGTWIRQSAENIPNALRASAARVRRRAWESSGEVPLELVMERLALFTPGHSGNEEDTDNEGASDGGDSETDEDTESGTDEEE